MKKALIYTATLVVVLSVVLAWPVQAQSPGAAAPGVLQVEVDRTTLSTDETLVLTVAVDAFEAMLVEPRLPPLDGFEIVSSHRDMQMSILNGRTTVVETYTYILHPTRAGELEIGSVQVDSLGRVYSSDPIWISVTQGTGKYVPPSSSGPSSPFGRLPGFGGSGFPNLPNLQAQPPLAAGPATPLDPSEAPAALRGQDFYVEARVDNLTPVQGEQVIYSFRFYRAVSLYAQPDYEVPPFTGLWHERQLEQKEYTLDAAGRSYRMIELQDVLFPTVSGPVTIDPGVLTLGGGLFDRGQTLRTDPVTLDVQTLPPGAPAGFQGAVGRYQLEAWVDTAQTRVNDTVTLHVTLSGEGNLASLPDPQWHDEPEWRAFDSQPSVETRFEGDQIVGSRSYERVLVPTAAGELTLAPIEYSFYDPSAGAYQTVRTEPIVVSVAAPLGGGVQAPVGAPPATGGGVAPATAPAAGKAPDGIRPIKPASEASRGASRNTAGRGSRAPLTQRSAFWLLWAVPPAIVVGQLAYRSSQRRRLGNITERRRRQAAHKARRMLKSARGSSEEAPAAVARILNDYLADKLARPIAGWTQTRVSELLEQRGVGPELVQRMRACLMAGEMDRYAPTGQTSSAGDLLDETRQVIDELEKVL